MEILGQVNLMLEMFTEGLRNRPAIRNSLRKIMIGI